MRCGGYGRMAATPMKKDAYIKVTMRDTAPVIQFTEK